MLSYALEKKPGCTLHESLYRQIRRDIECGAILPGQLLPSKRELARTLGISVATIESAYLQLVAEGYIESRPRRGFFACSLPANAKAIAEARIRLGASSDLPASEATNNSNMSIDSKRLGVPSGSKNSGAPSGSSDHSCAAHPTPPATEPTRFDLTGATYARRFFPAKEWGRLLREVLADQQEHAAGRLPARGSQILRSSIAHHIRLSRGIDASPEQVVIGAGAQQLYQMCALIFQGCTFAVEDPGYPSIASTYASLGRPVVPVSVDSSGMSTEALRRSSSSACPGASVAHVSPSHHFPTGAVMPAARRFELLAWAYEQPERFIVEDDYDCEFRLAGRPIPALAGVDVEGRVVYMNTFTKSMLGTLRLAYMVLPQALLPRFEETCGHLSCAASPIEQEAMARFIDSGGFDKQISRTCKRYRDCRNILVRGLDGACKHCKAHISRDEAGTFFLVEFAAHLDEAAFIARLAKRGVAATFVPPSSETRASSDAPTDAPSKLIVDYSALAPEQAAEAASILAEALNTC